MGGRDFKINMQGGNFDDAKNAAAAMRQRWSCYKEKSDEDESDKVPLYKQPTAKLEPTAALVAMIRLELRTGLSGNQTVSNEEILPLIQALRDQIVAQQCEIEELLDKTAQRKEQSEVLDTRLHTVRKAVQERENTFDENKRKAKTELKEIREFTSTKDTTLMNLKARVAGLKAGNDCLRKEIKDMESWVKPVVEAKAAAASTSSGLTTPKKKMWKSTTTTPRKFLPISITPDRFGKKKLASPKKLRSPISTNLQSSLLLSPPPKSPRLSRLRMSPSPKCVPLRSSRLSPSPCRRLPKFPLSPARLGSCGRASCVGRAKPIPVNLPNPSASR